MGAPVEAAQAVQGGREAPEGATDPVASWFVAVQPLGRQCAEAWTGTPGSPQAARSDGMAAAVWEGSGALPSSPLGAALRLRFRLRSSRTVAAARRVAGLRCPPDAPSPPSPSSSSSSPAAGGDALGEVAAAPGCFPLLLGPPRARGRLSPPAAAAVRPSTGLGARSRTRGRGRGAAAAPLRRFFAAGPTAAAAEGDTPSSSSSSSSSAEVPCCATVGPRLLAAPSPFLDLLALGRVVGAAFPLAAPRPPLLTADAPAAGQARRRTGGCHTFLSPVRAPAQGGAGFPNGPNVFEGRCDPLAPPGTPASTSK